MGREKKIVDFIFESGQLKLVKRSGWWVAGIKDPESVADHSYRAAVIAFVLADMEGADPHKLASALLFHDLPESRIQDLHKISQRYVEYDNGKVIEEQVRPLPEGTRKRILALWKLSTKEHDMLKDADLLEVAFQAKEYAEHGHPECRDWLENAGNRLKTRSAKQLFKELLRADPSSWWKGLKKLD
ncbi:MAG: HD domain-containing protein [Candidatus Bilamarchaeaceae archaeon]